MTQPLAIVGASTRAAAASAVRAGYQPITADLFADADLRRIATATRITPYPDGLLDWLRTIEPSAWMYTGALENHPDLVDAMAWLATLWGNPGDVLRCVRVPWNLSDALHHSGLLFPDTRDSPEGLPLDGTWLSKTYRGASGSGVRELTAPPPVREGLGEDADPYEVVYQRRIAGTPCSAVFIGAGGEAALLGVTRQLVGAPWLGAHGFQYSGSIGPLSLDERTLQTVAKIGNAIADRFELLGLFGVDLILDGDRVWTLEVNPRYAASIEVIERATGVHAIAAHVAACVETRLPDKTQILDRTHGKAVLYARRDVVISPEFAAWSLEQALAGPWPAVADVSVAGTTIEAGRPVLTLFAEGADIDDAERRLRDRVPQIERQLYAESM